MTCTHEPRHLCYGCGHCGCDPCDDESGCYVCGDCDDFFDGNPEADGEGSVGAEQVAS